MKGDAMAPSLSTDPDPFGRAAARPARRRGAARDRAAAVLRGRPDVRSRPRRGGGQNLMRAPVAAMVMSSVGVPGISAS